MVTDDENIDGDGDGYGYIRPKEHEQERLNTDVKLESFNSLNNVRRINQKYCGADTCRFMLPIAITEQESKAQYHFRQLAFLSGKLNRTIVLPNVHSSHLGACRQHPFDFYYDHSWMDNNREHFNYITMEQFKYWTEERRAVEAMPSGQEIYIEITPHSPHLAKANNCFRDQFDFTHRPSTRFQLEDPETESKRVGNYTKILMDVLGDDTRAKDYRGLSALPPPDLDVIHLFYDRRFGYIDDMAVDVPLGYHERWTTLADRIADQLYPFVAIHWRMERLAPLTHLMPCAEALVRKLQGINNVTNVFLLTDYPHLLTSPLAKPESMSFKLVELRQEHHDAIRYLYQHTNVTLTTMQRQDIPYDDLPSEHWNLIPIEAKPADKSILGIVDKLVAIRAQWFLYGQPAVCGKESSFTRRIRDERMEAFGLGDPKIMSPPVDIFGLK
ncbi:hypothetical protein BC941DRAFT_355683 [Chlamydoabsidia padenii]|nr:hypothetical protein BC941DRAFT_355683 [Chlamydoabsidia padenii]